MDANEIAARLTFLKGAKTECPICDQTRWVNPTDGRAILEITRDHRIERLPVIPLICNNCGFVRLVDERRLHD